MQALVGRKVIVRATVDFQGSLVKVIDVEGALTPELEAELLALKRPKPIDFSPKETYGAISASTDALTPADIQTAIVRWLPGDRRVELVVEPETQR